jgi:choline kinase
VDGRDIRARLGPNRHFHDRVIIRSNMRGLMVSQTVILAAGLGTRLASAEAGIPKPLVTVGGIPLIAHALAHAEASGCREAVVVIGYEGSRVKEAAEAAARPLAIRFVETPDASAPNGHSLLAAERFAQPRFFLQMVDHLFATAVLPRLIAGHGDDSGAARLLVDRAPVGLDLSDATKVRLHDDRVLAIGKGLESWDAIDTGCFVLTAAVFGALRAVAAPEPRTVSSAMRRLARRGELYSTDIGGIPWVDVDTPADRADAERFLTAWAETAAAGGLPRR